MRKTGSSAGVGGAVLEDGTLFVPVVALSPPTPSPLPVVLVLDRAPGDGLDLRGSFGGVFSFSIRLCLCPSAPSSPFVLALGKDLAFCISRCTTSSAILGEGGDGGGAAAFSSSTILFSTGSYRCSLRNERERVNFGSTLIDRYFRPSHLRTNRSNNGHLFLFLQMWSSKVAPPRRDCITCASCAPCPSEARPSSLPSPDLFISSLGACCRRRRPRPWPSRQAFAFVQLAVSSRLKVNESPELTDTAVTSLPPLSPLVVNVLASRHCAGKAPDIPPSLSL